MYALINDKKEIIVNIEDKRKIKLNKLIFKFKNIFEQHKKIFNKVAISKDEKPIREVINNFFSNNLYFLYCLLLMLAYNFHHVLQIY